MTTPDRPAETGVTDDYEVLRRHARVFISREIIGNYRRVASGYFTPGEIAAAKIEDALADPNAQLMPKDGLTDKDMLRLLANVCLSTPDDELQDQVDELEDSMDNPDNPLYERIRVRDAQLAIRDHDDVKSLMDRGLSQVQAIATVLASRTSEIERQIVAWQAFYEVAMENGKPVPSTIEEFANQYFARPDPNPEANP